ncbi:unnamed protein product, partial [Prorocentrum cordatum]
MDANTTQIGKQLDFAFVGALAELGERRVPGDRKTAQEEREIARVRDVQSTTEVFDGRLKLRAMTARLLRVYRARMLASVVLEAAPISTFVLLDKLFRDLLWSLYYSQILAGFWACLQLMASHQGMPPEEVPVTLCPREQLVVEGIPDVHFAFVGLTAAEHKRYEHINTLLAEYGTPRLLEIGVRVGDVPAYVLEHNPELTYVGVDPYFDEGGEHYRGQVDYDIAMSRIERFGSRAEIYRGVLSQMPTEGRDNFTAVFIDGDHSFMSAYKDTKLSEQLVMNGGLIMGHDFTPWYYGIMYAATLASLRHGSLSLSEASEASPPSRGPGGEHQAGTLAEMPWVARKVSAQSQNTSDFIQAQSVSVEDDFSDPTVMLNNNVADVLSRRRPSANALISSGYFSKRDRQKCVKLLHLDDVEEPSLEVRLSVNSQSMELTQSLSFQERVSRQLTGSSTRPSPSGSSSASANIRKLFKEGTTGEMVQRQHMELFKMIRQIFADPQAPETDDVPGRASRASTGSVDNETRCCWRWGRLRVDA